MEPKEINLCSNFRGRCLVDAAPLQIGYINAVTITVWQQLINRLSKPVKLCLWFWKADDFSFDMMWVKCS